MNVPSPLLWYSAFSPQYVTKQVEVAVVVVVADGDALAPAGAAQPGLVRDVSEGAVVIVAVEAVGSFGRRAVEAGAARP